MPTLLLRVLAVWFVLGLITPSVWGLPEFKKAFTDRYVTPSPDDEFKKIARKAGCNVCHVPGQKKDVHNAYGDELEVLITGNVVQRKKQAKKDGRAKQEIEAILNELSAAFDKVEGMKNDDGETFGERINAGKLPVDLPAKKQHSADPVGDAGLEPATPCL